MGETQKGESRKGVTNQKKKLKRGYRANLRRSRCKLEVRVAYVCQEDVPYIIKA